MPTPSIRACKTLMALMVKVVLRSNHTFSVPPAELASLKWHIGRSVRANHTLEQTIGPTATKLLPVDPSTPIQNLL